MVITTSEQLTDRAGMSGRFMGKLAGVDQHSPIKKPLRITAPELQQWPELHSRGTAETLQNCCDITQVTFTAPYYADIDLNDIIEIYAPSMGIPKQPTKHRFIVISIETVAEGLKLNSTIKAVRYD